jgi:hypothetical protein
MFGKGGKFAADNNPIIRPSNITGTRIASLTIFSLFVVESLYKHVLVPSLGYVRWTGFWELTTEKNPSVSIKACSVSFFIFCV